MKKLLDYDPVTGIRQYHTYDDLNKQVTIETVQDVEPFLERAKTLRNDEQYSRDGIKNEMWHYAHIPVIVVEQILQKYGVNIFEKGQAKEAFKIINRDYPHLKTTTGKHD